MVIGFADETELPRLGGTPSASAAACRRAGTRSRAWFGTGSIALDTEAFDGPTSGSGGAFLQSVVDHELGHVVGLGHVDRPGTELMRRRDLATTPSTRPAVDLEGFSILSLDPRRSERSRRPCQSLASASRSPCSASSPSFLNALPRKGVTSLAAPLKVKSAV